MLTANVPGAGAPGGIADWDFIDAAAFNLRSLAKLPLDLATIQAAFVHLTASGTASPAEALTAIASGYLRVPFSYARPRFAALANALPEPVGGTPSANPNTPGQGLIFDAFVWADQTYAELLNDIFAPLSPQEVLARQGFANVEPVDTWPPSTGRAFDTLEDVSAELVLQP